MNLFPNEYSKPTLLEIKDASELGWAAPCSDGQGAGSAGSTCANGTGAGYNVCVSLNNDGLFTGSDGSTNGRLINPGDVSQGL